MARTLTIADQHSSHKPSNTLVLPMEGGDPWYAYVWINDTLFTVTKDDTTGKVQVEPKED